MRLTRAALPTVALTLVVVPPTGAQSGEAIARGDAAWGRRTAGHSQLRAAPDPIADAISAYEQALAVQPDDLEARWKLMRALYYQGEYVLENRSHRRAVFARGLDLGETGIDQLAADLGGREALDRLDVPAIVEALPGGEHTPSIFYWTGIHWGVWGRETGKLEAVRRGVATKVRDYAEIVIGLDEDHDRGGAHRILGRLHFEAPKVPFVTGWVDPEIARRSLERAAELAPDDLLTRFYAIEALYKYDRSRRAEALELLRDLITSEPSTARPVEDARVLANAHALLEEWTR